MEIKLGKLKINGDLIYPVTLVDGIYDSDARQSLKTTLSEKATKSELNTHTGNSVIHVTQANKNAWNAKYDKPGTGIPYEDLSKEVQESLDKAESAIQDISMKEDKVNKVQNNITPENSDSEILYPSVKATTGYVSEVKSELETEISQKADQDDFTAHTSDTDIHTNPSEKAVWTAKYDKPAGGIPKTDLESDVQASLEKADNSVQKNPEITGGTKCKITYDSKGLVTAGTDLTTTDLPSGIPIAKIEDLQAVLDSKVPWSVSEEATGADKLIRKSTLTDAINSLDVSGVGGTGKYIESVSETDGKISATASDLPVYTLKANTNPGTGNLASYYLEKKVGDTVSQAGVVINIPSEKVIIAAGVVQYGGGSKITINGIEYDVQGTHPNGTYIVMIVSNSDQIWVPSSSFLYTSGSDPAVDPVVIEVSADNKITAYLGDGKIEKTKLTQSLQTEITGKVDKVVAEEATTSDKLIKKSTLTSAINALDVSATGGSGKYLESISETDGKISATAKNLPVYSLVKLTTPETGYEATYQLTKDGTKEGVSINIPKDKVISDAGVVAYNGSDPVITINGVSYQVQGTHTAGTYIVFIVQNGNQLWVPAVSIYTSGSVSTDPVVISISADNKITATLTDGKIEKGKLTSALQSEITGKEDKTNKATSWAATPTDTKYPSEKLVKTSLDQKLPVAGDTTNLTQDFTLKRRGSEFKINSTGISLSTPSYYKNSEIATLSDITQATDEVFEVIAKAFAQGMVTEVFWRKLKILRDTHQLIPGMWYRITDYRCSTSQEGTRTAGNLFDILVLALSEDTLSENARAIRHAGDHYFDTEHPEAWTLRYSLDNDKSRFAWAVDNHSYLPKTITGVRTDTGEEVTLTYAGFKNNVTDYFGKEVHYYTSGNSKYFIFTPGDTKYASTSIASNSTIEEGNFSNVMGSYNLITTGESVINYTVSEEPGVSFGTGVVYYLRDEYENEVDYDFKNIQFLRDSTWKAKKGATSDSMTFGDAATYLKSGNNYYYTFTFIDASGDLYDLSLYETYRGISGTSPTSGGWRCYRNKIFSEANNSVGFPYQLSDNIFVGNAGIPNTHARYVAGNVFINCYSNTFGGRNVADNEFFGTYDNVFADGGYCSHSQIPGPFYQNIIGGSFQNNYFYCGARQNTFKGDSIYNIFIGNWISENIIEAPFYGCQFGSRIQYVRILGTDIIRDYVFSSGLHGVSGNLLQVTPQIGNATERVIAQNSDGVVKDFVIADLIS